MIYTHDDAEAGGRSMHRAACLPVASQRFMHACSCICMHASEYQTHHNLMAMTARNTPTCRSSVPGTEGRSKPNSSLVLYSDLHVRI